MKTYIPLQVKTDATLLKSATKPKHIIARLQKLGIERCAITDENSLASAVEFLEILPNGIIGCTITIEHADSTSDKVILLARNINGWKSLIRIVSLANQKRQQVQLDSVGYCENIICICYAKPLLLQNHFKYVYLGLNYNTDNKNIRALAKEENVKCVALCNAYYPSKEDVDDQRVLIAMDKKQTMYNLRLHPFFISDEYYIPSYEEMASKFTNEELQATIDIGELCENIDIAQPPQLPKFECPNNMTDIEYLKYICREGFKQKIPKNKYKEYGDRAKYELQILEEANLASYFLIVRDIVKYAQQQGFLTGVARGSAAGCLVSYLIDITQIDPLTYGLIFERFYDVSRKGSLPDIDIDVPHKARQTIIDYLKNKYGNECVAQLITFQTMQGRNALKGVLTAYRDVSAAEMNRITENIIDKAKISDELAELEDKSLIRYSLEHHADKFKEWCLMDKNKQLSGPLAPRFEHAIKLEGTRLYQSKHAAGIIITHQPLYTLCPLIFDKHSNQQLVGLEMEHAEKLGALKIDVLGIDMLDKLMDIQYDLAQGVPYE